MEAPDKIWINTDTLNGYHMSNHPLYGEEYLRKGALLGWAKESMDSLGRLSYGEFIEKLNSM